VVYQHDPKYFEQFVRQSFPYTCVQVMEFLRVCNNSVMSTREFVNALRGIVRKDIAYREITNLSTMARVVPDSDIGTDVVHRTHVNLLNSRIEEYKGICKLVKSRWSENFSLYLKTGCSTMFPYYVPVTNKSVEIVTLFDGLRLVETPYLLLYDVFRILCIGGILLIRDRDVDRFLDSVLVELDHIVCVRDMFSKSRLSLVELTAMLKFIGFGNIKVIARNLITCEYYLRCVRGFDSEVASVFDISQMEELDRSSWLDMSYFDPENDGVKPLIVKRSADRKIVYDYNFSELAAQLKFRIPEEVAEFKKSLQKYLETLDPGGEGNNSEEKSMT